MTKIPKQVSEYMAKIGSKGGQAAKGSKVKKKAISAAMIKHWADVRAGVVIRKQSKKTKK